MIRFQLIDDKDPMVTGLEANVTYDFHLESLNDEALEYHIKSFFKAAGFSEKLLTEYFANCSKGE